MYRGNPYARKMVIGEAPGLHEDRKGRPFVGKAGELLDRIFASAGWNVEEDWYIGNLVKCRPIAPEEAVKQNSKPLAAHRKACAPYFLEEVRIVQPRTIVLMGRTAVDGVLGKETRGKPLADLTGRIFPLPDIPEVTLFIMYHPAALLHAQRDPDRHLKLRQDTWNHIKLLRELINEQEGR
jgi:DNA polymerase